MLSHEEMIGLQAEKHDLIDTDNFQSREQYVLHLIHSFAYAQLSAVAADKAVLDFGCNTGYGSRILSEVAGRVVGVDVSAEAIAQAEERYRGRGIEFHLIDGKRLPFDDGAFDLVVSCQVIEHIVDYGLYLGELKRVLAPGGAVVFTTPNSRLRLDPGMKPWNAFHVREFDHLELRELLERHFPAVSVLGLQAKESLARIEKERVDRARRGARARRNPSVTFRLRSLATGLLPAGARARLKAALASEAQKPMGFDEAFRERNSWDDLHHGTEALDEALDLMAVCSDDPGVLRDTLARFKTA